MAHLFILIQLLAYQTIVGRPAKEALPVPVLFNTVAMDSMGGLWIRQECYNKRRHEDPPLTRRRMPYHSGRNATTKGSIWLVLFRLLQRYFSLTTNISYQSTHIISSHNKSIVQIRRRSAEQSPLTCTYPYPAWSHSINGKGNIKSCLMFPKNDEQMSRSKEQVVINITRAEVR